VDIHLSIIEAVLAQSKLSAVDSTQRRTLFRDDPHDVRIDVE
jgi:hypothetical protein